MKLIINNLLETVSKLFEDESDDEININIEDQNQSKLKFALTNVNHLRTLPHLDEKFLDRIDYFETRKAEYIERTKNKSV